METTIQSLTHEIFDKIPIAQAFGMEITELNNTSCKIKVPLSPNRNHKNTAFGGSLYVGCTLASYGLLYYLQKINDLTDWDLVIADGHIRYLLPTTHDFTVEAALTEFDAPEVLMKLTKGEKVRVLISAVVRVQGKGPATTQFSGQFTFLPKRSAKVK